MILRRIFIAGLLGCTMLAGCDGDDKNNNSGQSTFDPAAIEQLKGQVNDLRQALDTEIRDRANGDTQISALLAEIKAGLGKVETDAKASATRSDTLNSKITALETAAAESDHATRLTALETGIREPKQCWMARSSWTALPRPSMIIQSKSCGRKLPGWRTKPRLRP
ncbi:hypothetical protein [Phyllobacterium zundukense]|uniref:Uncharacterized protein n=1 Tax=Phyllobacterium zundukense TaxID=1867719 RepID=A0ACD4D733_9HYPH|nr:hypothetical protein [Phyllobacterium zundukense]UXN61503.1 hypothetical protein N8E88_15675 [Phyllobacterium zundukense]